MYPTSKGLMVAAAMFVMATPALAQSPSGDVTFSSENVGGEVRRVDGNLHFKDHSYPFTVSGVRVETATGNRDSGAGRVQPRHRQCL